MAAARGETISFCATSLGRNSFLQVATGPGSFLEDTLNIHPARGFSVETHPGASAHTCQSVNITATR